VRARLADVEGFVEVDGVNIGYEVHGSGSPTVLLLPTWTIINARFWKSQIPYLARHFRVVTFDGPGNGRSDRPLQPSAYGVDAYAAAALRVLDATETASAVGVSLSAGAAWHLKLLAEHPGRALGAVFIAPSLPLAPGHLDRAESIARFDDPVEVADGWAKYNRHYWQRDWRGFLEFFFSQCFSEPHSTKQIEDSVGWGLETTPDVMVAEADAPGPDEALVRQWCAQVRSPVLVIHGSDDRISPLARGQALAQLTSGTLVTLDDAGHIPLARDPVKVNLLIEEFVQRVGAHSEGRLRWARGRARPRRALYLSSPIGLGHAQRDVAVARELRALVPGLEIDWLAQHPVTRVLDEAGERVHSASRALANESTHIESESGEHDLHCFQAWRRMDEILVSNFMVFHDVVSDGDYDLVIGDEAWDVDYYLHENPELKRFSYAWFTDFVGWLPMPSGGDQEAILTADYNAEMIEHIARYPRTRDRAIFVGDPDDIVPDDFGPSLPGIREWTEQHYNFSGYITGFQPTSIDRESSRAEFGYRHDELVCIVTVGGSGVGTSLLRRVMAAFPAAKRATPALRMIVVAGPRIDPASLPHVDGLEVRQYVHELYRHLAVCDLAVVQGGLTTCMELTAAGRPFLYVPLSNHFEQNFHVAHRLNRYRAGHRLDADVTPDELAIAISQHIGTTPSSRPVEGDGARRAAGLLADLL
jgi:pimeloyl-ACP methyl ester carboxylesterase/predicted glycosyltransferase